MEKLDQLTVPQLKARLRERGASIKGTKTVLAARLRDIYENEEDGTNISEYMTFMPSWSRDQPCIRRDEDSASLSEVAMNDRAVGAESVFSCRSFASDASIQSLRAIEASKRAALLARASFLEEKRKIKQEELNLRLRKEQMMISAELAEVEARDRILMEASQRTQWLQLILYSRLQLTPSNKTSHLLTSRTELLNEITKRVIFLGLLEMPNQPCGDFTVFQSRLSLLHRSRSFTRSGTVKAARWLQKRRGGVILSLIHHRNLTLLGSFSLSFRRASCLSLKYRSLTVTSPNIAALSEHFNQNR